MTASKFVDEEIITARVGKHKLELYYRDDLFRPNPVTTRFYRQIGDVSNKVVYDIGTGIGPIAIAAALDGASDVYGSDVVEDHVEFAMHNASHNRVTDLVTFYKGNLFENFDSRINPKADVIVGDVSGIAEVVGKTAGWYSDIVPAGGDDGTKPTIEMIEQSPKYLSEFGFLIFAVAHGFSSSEKVLECAKDTFSTFEEKPGKLAVTGKQYADIVDRYGGNRPAFLDKLVESNGYHISPACVCVVKNPK